MSLGFAMFTFKVLTHPLDKVVFEYPLDELVQQVWSDEFVNISIGEVFCERLGRVSFGSRVAWVGEGELTVASLTIP